MSGIKLNVEQMSVQWKSEQRNRYFTWISEYVWLCVKV